MTGEDFLTVSEVAAELPVADPIVTAAGFFASRTVTISRPGHQKIHCSCVEARNTATHKETS
jgi:hypothetical protein